MAMRDAQRRKPGRGFFAVGIFALSLQHASAAPIDREQGLPLVNTILPIRYNTPASPVGPQAFALAALPDGSIVVANNSGLLRLTGTEANAWNPLHGNVLSLASAADGTVYVGGIGDIGYFKDFGREFESLAAWAAKLNVQFGDFWIAVAAQDGSAYFADAIHVFRWDGHALRLAYTGQPEMLQGAAFGNGVVVFDPGAGLVAVSVDSAHVVPGSDRLKRAGPCALASASGDVISVCMDGSVMRWRADGVLAELPVDNAVRELLTRAGVTTARMSDDGSLMIGTRRAGMLWLDANAMLSGRLSIPEWGESRVFSLLPRHADGFWVGLDYGVAHVEWPGQLARYDALLGLPRAVIATIRVNGELLVATTRGVYRVAPAAAADMAFARFETYVPTQTTLFAVAQSGGTLFVASGEGVYAVRDGAPLKPDSQLAYSVLPLNADASALLAGGLNGVRVLRKIDARWSGREVPEVDTEIRHFQPDENGAIWLTGNYGGAFRLHLAASADAPPTIERFGAAEGLPAGRIVPLALPDRIVFDSADGLLRFDSAARRFVADVALRALLPKSQGATRIVAALDTLHALVVQHDRVRLIERGGDGSWHEAFTPLARLPRGMDFRDVRVDADGTVWIAGNAALFRHRAVPQALPDLPRPQIQLDDGGADGAGAGVRRLGVAPRNVRVRFEEAFFDGVEQLRFRTRLEPLETGWSDWQQAPAREMTHLPGGSYRLAVQARDIFGRDSEPSSIAFALAPPWYLRWWAFMLAALGFFVLLAWLIRRRDRVLRRRAAELAELVRERTQELEKASITDALTGLRNRHYVQLTGTPWHNGASAFWLIALLDIDHFKRINDERGHDAGDEVLRSVAHQLAAALPNGAVAVRWGGEEFLVIVAIDAPAQAPELVRRLLHAIGGCMVTLSAPPPLTVTCSMGWDVVQADTTSSLDMVLSSADHKLYAAKHAGRDRAFGPDPAQVIRR